MAIHIKPEALSERIKIDKNMDIVQKTTSTPSSSNRIGTFGVDGRSDIGMIEFKANYFGATKILQVTKKFSIDGISTTTTTTTTTTTPKPTQYTVSGTFAVRLFSPQMVMIDPNGDERIVDVEFENPSTGLRPSYDAYVVTTTFDPSGYKLRVSGYDALTIINRKYWAGEITLPRLQYWSRNASTGDYSIIRNFTSSILTTTTSTTTSTTTAAPTTYEYTIQVNSTSADLAFLQVSVSNSQTLSRLVAGVKNGDVWTFNFTMPVFASTGWKFEFTGTGSVNQKKYTATLTNQTFVEGVCTISYLILKTGLNPSVPSLGPTAETMRPFSVDNPEDTNSLDDAINDYLNE